MNLLRSIPLVLLALPLSYSLQSLSDANRCSWQAQAAEIQRFGIEGKAGNHGKVGKNGDKSEDLTIFVDGSPLSLNLSGKNGENGGDGEPAKAPDCPTQPVDVSYNLQAANGGNGGNGGDGGSGGDGGNLTLYATNIAHLQQILVRTQGGQGGKGGNGAMGSQGCRCSVPFWTVETCTGGKPGDPDYRCTNQEFRCSDGQSGVSGINGRDGNDGRLGQLTLISLNRPLESDRPAASTTFAQIKEQGFLLSKNQWETRTGAAALFASGSAIADSYRMMVSRQEKTFFLTWNAPQPFEPFASYPVTLSLADESGIEVTLPKDVWLEATTRQQPNEITEFIVYNAILARDATRLEPQKLTGTGKSLQLTLIDRADRSDLIATQFRLKYKTTQSQDARFRPSVTFTTRYDGEIPPDLVERNGDRFTLNLGQLPLDENYLRSGTGVELEISALRSFAGNNATQQIQIKDLIPPR